MQYPKCVSEQLWYSRLCKISRSEGDGKMQLTLHLLRTSKDANVRGRVSHHRCCEWSLVTWGTNHQRTTFALDENTYLSFRKVLAPRWQGRVRVRERSRELTANRGATQTINSSRDVTPSLYTNTRLGQCLDNWSILAETHSTSTSSGFVLMFDYII